MRNRHVLINSAVTISLLCSLNGAVLALDSAGSGFWDDGATWVGGVAPTAADDVTIKAGHTIAIRDVLTHDVRSLTIENTGMLTHSANSTTALGERYKVILSVENDLTIDAGGAIDADDKGYSGNNGPGKPAGSYAGGSHGGIGGSHGSYTANRGTTYGSIVAPTNCGSGGADGGRYGGGAVILNVGGATTVNGYIAARGTTNNTLHSYIYEGSGGSVFLTTGTFGGSGTIDAGAVDGSTGGGGGGGRIAVILTNSTHFGSVTLRAFGGNSTRTKPGCGTIYLQHKDHAAGQGKLVVDGGGVVPGEGGYALQNGLHASSHAFSEIVFTNSGVYALDSDDTLDLSNTVLSGSPQDLNDGITLAGGTLTVPAAYSFTNYFVRILDSSSTFGPAASLTVATNATLRIERPFTLNCPLTIRAGGMIDHSANRDAEINKIDLTVHGSLDVEAGGEINVDGKGYAGGFGPGKGGYASGGGHGGMGGYHNSYQNPGTTYGSISSPTNCGSGGGTSAGAGAVILRVRDQTTLNGNISARGPKASYPGSGGSVFLTTGTLTGSGTIDAGSLDVNGVAPGGGGRIAVILTNGNSFGSVSMQAFSPAASHQRGASGTIYTQTKDQGPGRGTLLIDANGLAPAALSSTLIRDLVADAAVGAVIVTNAARLVIADQTLAVSGDILNTATFTGQAGSTLLLAGTSAASVRGDIACHNLTCTNAGKVVSFEDGRTTVVNGVLTLADVTVDSISGSGAWYLHASAFTHSVSNVTAGRSDARPGAQITAYDSTDAGGNFNWVFTTSGPQVNTWTGATDSDWSKPANWSQNRPTIESDDVIIPGGCPNYPLLDFDKRMRSLSISNAASMGLNGYNLTVDTDTAVAGTLTATGAVSLTLRGDLDFSGGGAFDGAGSTLRLVGSGTQTVVSAGNTFHDVLITNPAAPVVFADAANASTVDNRNRRLTFGGALTLTESFRSQGTNLIFGGAVAAPLFDSRDGALVFSGTVSAVAFTNWAGDATFNDDVSCGRLYCAPGGVDLTFAAGSTCTIGDFEVYGRNGFPIRLRSSVDTSLWYLDVTNSASARHVDVKDSNANAGLTVYPAASVDSGNTFNWVFSSPWLTWDGSESTAFTDADNWTPAVAPDENARLLIEGYTAVAPVLSGVATVAQAIVGSVTTATLTVNGHLTVLENLDILPTGTMTHSPNAAAELNKLYLTVGSNLTVQGEINVDGKGFSANNGPGAPAAQYASGSHGGIGSVHNNYQSHVGTVTYGSLTSPTNCGSGGGYAPGGGAAILRVGRVTRLSGRILARGSGASNYQGAGGSVFLTTGTLTGSGLIDAGSWGDSTTCPGGGGRIAVVLTEGNDFGSVGLQARSAWTSMQAASPGTVYMQTSDQGAGNGTLLIDANGVVPSALSATLIHDQVTDTEVGTVVIANAAKLEIDDNQSLTVNGDWVNTATFVGTNSGATVTFASTAPAAVRGDDTFYNFDCTAAGKTLCFEAGRTTTVRGKLTLKHATLCSTTPGDRWFLVLATGATQEVGAVTVQDSDANGGQEIVAGKVASVYSVDQGNNENWRFLRPSGTLIVLR